MSERFRTQLTRVPAVRISVGRHGLATCIGWDGGGPPQGLRDGGSKGAAPAFYRTVGDPRRAGPLPTDRFLVPGTRSDYGGGDVSGMTSPGLESFKALLVAAAQRQREIVADTARARWQLRLAWTARALGWATLLSAAIRPLREAARRGVETRRSELNTLGGNLAATAVSVDFDMESEVGPPHPRMQAAFDRVAASGRTWAVDSRQHIDRVKARSLAGTVVDRKPTRLGRTADPLVATQDPPLALTVQGGKATAYIYPGFVLVAGAAGFALIDLVDFDVQAAVTQFTETEGVPGDATVVGETWAKSNKDGSRDRRFASNMELPIVRYGQLGLSGPGGFSEVFIASQAQPCTEFGSAVQDLRRVLTLGRRRDKVGNGRKTLRGS